MNKLFIFLLRKSVLLCLIAFVFIPSGTSQDTATVIIRDSLVLSTTESDTLLADSSAMPLPTHINFTDTTKGLNINMIAIEAGSFMMGSDLEEEEQPIHLVSLDEFYIGKFEVTQAQWVKIMGYNPSKNKGDSLPVEQISWNSVQKFITKLNQLTGKTYRLPTEAEWEYAARAGTETLFHMGNCLSPSDANYNGNFPYKKCEKGIYRRKQLPVGSFEPNAWGLYDIHGNVWEWCNDIYSDNYYKISPEQNPKGAEKGVYRVIRGGGWGYFADGCRSANRGFYGGSISYDDIGFRLACSADCLK